MQDPASKKVLTCPKCDGAKIIQIDPERLTGALLDRLTHHVHILEMNGESYRLNQRLTEKDLSDFSVL